MDSKTRKKLERMGGRETTVKEFLGLTGEDEAIIEHRLAKAHEARQGMLERMDPAGLPALLYAIRHLHGLEATWLESVPVREVHGGLVVWDGEVQVFEVQHPKASRCYAWSHESEGGRRRFHAVLGAPPVDSALDAVRVAVVSEFKAAQN